MIRLPAVAGVFYSADPQQLKQDCQRYLGNADTLAFQPKAMVLPHAGYIYSAPIAATGYRLLNNLDTHIDTVVLLGPSHRVAFKGMALSSAEAYRSPLGDIAIAQDLQQKVAHLPEIQVLDAAHTQEHSLEVHLPFLQTTLSDFALLPVVIGQASIEAVQTLLNTLWDDEHTLIVISSDLSHYNDYETARQLDQHTSETIEALDVDQLDNQAACGFYPLRGLMALARTKGVKATTVDLRNSGDTAGSKQDKVVGYGAYVFH